MRLPLILSAFALLLATVPAVEARAWCTAADDWCPDTACVYRNGAWICAPSGAPNPCEYVRECDPRQSGDERCTKLAGGAAVCTEWKFAEACVTVHWGVIPLAPKTHCNPVPGPAI